MTGVKSKAMTSPCGQIRIPINEEGTEEKGQIQEYLDMYDGEGIQSSIRVYRIGSNAAWSTKKYRRLTAA